MEAQGPEHSSARLERFLQLCDDEHVHVPGTEPGAPGGETVEQIMTRQLFEINWIVCNITAPANMVHVLRRQILMPFRKPLVRFILYLSAVCAIVYMHYFFKQAFSPRNYIQILLCYFSLIFGAFKWALLNLQLPKWSSSLKFWRKCFFTDARVMRKHCTRVASER